MTGPGRPKKRQPSITDMLGELSDALKQQARQPNLYGYNPLPKQDAFHRAPHFGRLFKGGNQTGKTTCGVVEDLWWATKRHPYRRIPGDLKVAGRVIGVDFLKGVDRILVPEFKRWVLPSDLKNGSWEDSWDAYRHELTFADGSFIEFQSYEQMLDKFAGTKRHFIHFDEEPPEAIYGECMARLLAQDPAAWWITMTPVEGMTWVYERMIESRPDDIFLVEADTEENTYLPKGSVKRTLGNLSEDEQRVRKQGAFIPKGGRVYPDFFPSVHANNLPDDWWPPADWTIWTSTDSGWNNPACHLWTAVSPNMEDVVTFYEMYDSEVTVPEWCHRIHEFESEGGLTIYNRVGDPAMKQKSPITGTSVQFEYATRGIVIALDSIPSGINSVGIGVEKIRQYLKVNKRTNRPFWQIVGSKCPYLVKQMNKLEWASIQSPKLRDQSNRPEQIKKKDDHAPDAIRYNFTCFPDLTDDQLKNPMKPEPPVENSYLDTLVKMAEAEGEFGPGPIKSPRHLHPGGTNWEADYWSDPFDTLNQLPPGEIA